MHTNLAGLPATHRLAQTAAEKGRISIAMRWPLGGIRTHILYNAPGRSRAGLSFHVYGPDDAAFETFATTFAHFPGVEFVRVAVRGKSCPLWQSVRANCALVAASAFAQPDRCHARRCGLISVLACRISRQLHDVFRPCHFAGWRGRAKTLAAWPSATATHGHRVGRRRRPGDPAGVFSRSSIEPYAYAASRFPTAST